MGGIAVVSNPRARANRANPGLVRRLAYVLGDEGEVAQPPDLDHLEEAMARFRDRGVDVLCVSGGDGTLHKTLSAAVRVYGAGRALGEIVLPRVAILRSGTVNTMARNVGVRLGPDDMLGRIVAAWHQGAPLQLVERTLLVVNGLDAGFLFGTGVLARFMEAYYAGKEGPGPWKAVKVLARTVASALTRGPFAAAMFRRDPLRVVADGREWAAPAFSAVAAGTMADIGLGFRPFFRAPAHLDHLHALGFACDAEVVAKALPRIYLARPIGHPAVTDEIMRRLVIESTDGGGVGFMMDGDFLPGGPRLVVEAGPRVRFVQSA